MPREDRAKIFAPFSALSGHAERTREQERITESRIELSENSIAEINTVLQTIYEQLCLGKKSKVSVTYFEEDKERKGEGIYKTVSGYVSKVDTCNKILIVDSLKIKMDLIYKITMK